VWPAIFITLLAFSVAALAVGWLARGRAARIALDEPNARSLHAVPVPRTGGIGLLFGVAAGWTLVGTVLPWTLWVATAVVITISLLDDIYGLPAAVRLVAHLFAATLTAISLLGGESLLLVIAAVFAISWMCNLYNFMDGADGLAGGMALFGFFAYAVAAWFSGSTQFALLNLAIAAAAAGFLVHNFHPARIFLGDSGSVALGFLAATFGIIGWLQHDWTWWFPLLVFSPFIVDASVTLAKRLLAGTRVWEAHRDHYYQRLVQLGWGHRNTACAEYALMVVCVSAGLWAMTLNNNIQHLLLTTVGIVYLVAIIAIEIAWRKKPTPMPNNIRTLLAIAHDLAAVAIAWLLAFWLRFNLELPEPYNEQAWLSLRWVVPLYGVILYVSGLYRGIWRYASLSDLQRIILAVGSAALAVTAMLFMLQLTVPRSVLVMSPVLLVVLMGGSRLAYRGWKEHRLGLRLVTGREPVVVLGAGEAAANLVKDLARSTQWQIIGIFDDDHALHHRQIHGITVLGAIEDLPVMQPQLHAQRAIIAMPEAGHRERRRAIETARAAGLQVLTVPSFDDLLSGRVTVSQIRKIELDDLLGRDPVQLDTSGLREWLGEQVVLVTGAGGSIGSELCRQVARYRPRCIVLLENSEFSLYTVEQEFTQRFPDTAITSIIGNVTDPRQVRHVLATYRPTVVFHAAAYKHVPLMESENAWQAVLNNVLGTRVLAEASIAHDVGKFVLISTDKAVNPTNVMGATKRLAELVCQSLQRKDGTRFVIVRFGNVLGSTGSVIPKFREQIAAGGPVTVTHPEINRYFMSIPEAVQLVMQAGLMGKGGEIFVLDMGEPVKIADLARDMIRLSGFDENEIRIVYTGLRPGEKLYEEVLADGESSLPTPHPKLRIAQVRPADPALLVRLSAWLGRTDAPDADTVKAELSQWLPEYSRR
jgi:FlaA1/EpsC-like NDP-sugar epimerase/UDP-N-acetylmuramyl pentapeptide phosphotransferase/UDP-N-acetylglucosamine-1-phosphate transferase